MDSRVECCSSRMTNILLIMSPRSSGRVSLFPLRTCQRRADTEWIQFCALKTHSFSVCSVCSSILATVNQEGQIEVFYDLEEAKAFAYPMSLDFAMTKKGSLPVVVGSVDDKPKGDGAGGKKKK